MSYEGYFQVLCFNFHYSTIDCYEFPIFHKKKIANFIPENEVKLWACKCGANAIWYNSVDLTNGLYCSCKKGIELDYAGWSKEDLGNLGINMDEF